MTPDRWLHPSVEAAVEAEARAGEVEERGPRWIARWGPLIFIIIALVAVGVVVTIAVIAIGNLDDAVEDVNTIVEEERCRDEHRDDFFINIVKNIEGREGAPSLESSVEELESVYEDCGIPKPEEG